MLELQKALRHAMREADEAEAELVREREKAQQRDALVTMLRAYTNCLLVLTSRPRVAGMQSGHGAVVPAGAEGISEEGCLVPQ